MKKILVIFAFALAMCTSCTSKQSAPVESTQDSTTVVIDTCVTDSGTLVVDTVGVV